MSAMPLTTDVSERGLVRLLSAIGLSRFAAGERGFGVDINPLDIRFRGVDLPV